MNLKLAMTGGLIMLFCCWQSSALAACGRHCVHSHASKHVKIPTSSFKPILPSSSNGLNSLMQNFNLSLSYGYTFGAQPLHYGGGFVESNHFTRRESNQAVLFRVACPINF